MIRDFARNVVSIKAATDDGRPLALRKQDKQTWAIDSLQTGVKIFCQVFAWELSVRTSHLDTTHGYFNGPCLFLKVHGLEDQPCLVELLPPPDHSVRWTVATSLQPRSIGPGGFGLYQAQSYEDLIDHPVEMGAIHLLEFSVRNIPHRIAISGRHRVDGRRLIGDLTRVCEQHAALFGELPVDRYWFLVTALGEGYGGLEHRYSTSLQCMRGDLPSPGTDRSPEGYWRFLGLCSHEYFHLWHVKRIQPLALLAGGLDHEVHTRLLWCFEGTTSYYDELALVRSGCIDRKTYLGMLAETITRVMRGPGRRVQTLAEASFDAWIKFYKPDENAPNALVSYYAKGALVALALDLTIRQETAGAKSLDDVMRELWFRYGRTGIGVPEHGVEDVAMQVTGLNLLPFFAAALDSTTDLDLVGLFATVGIAMRLRANRGSNDLGGCVDEWQAHTAGLSLEVRLRPKAAEPVIQYVISGGAGERAGLAPGDLIVAVDGLRATAENLERLIDDSGRDFGEVRLHLFRRDELMSVVAQPLPPRDDTCELMLLESVSEEITQARAAWLVSVG